MSWMALPRPSRSSVVTLGDAVSGLLDTPVGKNVLMLVQSGAWNATGEGAQTALPTFWNGGDAAVRGIATCITDWMRLDGKNVYDASWMPVKSVSPNVVAPTVDPPAATSIVDHYFQSAAGLWAVVYGNPAQVAALQHVDWSVPFGAVPWEWLSANAATVDWPTVLNALQANPGAFASATEPPHDFGNFGLFGWLQPIESTSRTWAQVPYEVFSVSPSFSDVLKRFPWGDVDVTKLDGTAAALLGAIGLASPAQQAAGFPVAGKSLGPAAFAPVTGQTPYTPGVVGLVNPKQPIQPGLIRTTVGTQKKTPAADTGSGVGWWLAGGAALVTAVALGMRKKKGRK